MSVVVLLGCDLDWGQQPVMPCRGALPVQVMAGGLPALEELLAVGRANGWRRIGDPPLDLCPSHTREFERWRAERLEARS